MTKKQLNESTRILVMMGPVKHKRPPKPKKKAMEHKFKMEVDQKGKPSIQEVK